MLSLINTMFLKCYAVGKINTIAQSSNATGGIKTVTAQEFTEKWSAALNVLVQAFGGIVEPIIRLNLVISIIVLIVGGMLNSQSIRKWGTIGLGTSVLSYFIYKTAPFWMGLFQTAIQAFN